MMDDYVFLEDVGRRVGGWGREIVQGGFGSANANANVGKGSSTRGGQSKRDILKMQLEAKDIQVDLLPLGMHRRKLNQSTWDPKSVFVQLPKKKLIFHFSKESKLRS
jgi:hypothetical protein